MPIYEYTCGKCGRASSAFFRSVSAVIEKPSCPHCGHMALTRRMSRVWSRRAAVDESAASHGEPSFEHDGIPFYGGDPSMLSDSYGDAMFGDDQQEDDGDVAQFAREARAMSAVAGEPLDPELDTALRHIERGADPDEVFGEMDARAASSNDDIDA